MKAQTLQFFVNGEEFTTRTRLEYKYKLPHATIQQILNDAKPLKVKDLNKHYFLRIAAENAIEAYIQQQLVAKAAKKKHLLPVPKFEYRTFDEHQTSL